jgi:hypothetical protein
LRIRSELIRNKQKIKSFFEKYFNLIQKNQKKISDANEAIEKLTKEKSASSALLRRYNKKASDLKSSIVKLLEKMFSARFVINLPSLI